MWESILELCADMFGVTVHSRLGQLALFCAALFGLALFLVVRWGFGGLAVPAAMFALAVLAARQVTAARAAAWRAACAPLDAPGQRPEEARGRVLSASATALARLGGAVDRVRRAQPAAAGELLPHIDRTLLRPEEAQLLDAVRAMISVELGSRDRAAKQAATALPTGSEDLDGCLGRALVADAWDDPARLAAIHAAWTRAGVSQGPLSRLSRLTRVRIDVGAIDEVPHDEARDLAEEARALGDESLAAELDARGRAAAYR